MLSKSNIYDYSTSGNLDYNFDDVILDENGNAAGLGDNFSIAAPGLSVIAEGFTQVGRHILSTDGLMGTFFRTATRLAKNTGVQQFFHTFSQAALLAAKGVAFVIESIGGLSEMFGGFLPVIAGGIVAFTIYQAITAVITTTMNITKTKRNEEYYRQRRIGIIKQDTSQRGIKATLGILKVNPEISDISNPNIDSVGNVGSVDKINDTVDIASEDLRYFREAAEKMSEFYFTQNAIASQINLTFGDVKETADVDKIINEITNSLEECIATAANGVPAI